MATLIFILFGQIYLFEIILKWQIVFVRGENGFASNILIIIMKKVTNFIQVLCLACILQVSFAGLTRMSFQDIQMVDVGALNCQTPQPDFAAVLEGLSQWGEAQSMAQTGQLSSDIDLLHSISLLAKMGMESASEDYLGKLQQSISKVNLFQAQNIAKKQAKHIQQQIDQILESDDDDTRKSCCAMLYGLVQYLIGELTSLNNQCQQPMTINIEGDIKRVQIIQSGCGCQPPSCVNPPTPTPPITPPHIKTPPSKIKTPKDKTPPPPPPKDKTPPPPPQKDKTPEIKSIKQKTPKIRLPTPKKPKTPTPVRPDSIPPTSVSTPPPPTTPPKQLTPPPPPKVECIEGPDQLIDAAYNAKAPIDAEIGKEELDDPSQYGYGFWMRYLTRYPVPLYNGRTAPWYFISRLTQNKNYGNVNFGDRTLAIFQGTNAFFFVTNDVATSNSNVFQSIPYEDIEGVWTYVYFSYSQNKATAFLKYSDQENIFQLNFQVTHPVPDYFRFVMGGTDLNQYAGFNGQFARPVLRVGFGSYIGSVKELNEFALSCNPLPKPPCSQRESIVLIKRVAKNFDEIVYNKIEQPFPEEYAVSGWFKWATPVSAQKWHLMFRVALNNQESNNNAQLLGDRDLAAFVGTEGNLQFATYSYTEFDGTGNPNAHQNTPYKLEQLTHWHWVYFGYSRPLRQAFARIIYNGGEHKVEFQDVNHFLAAKRYVAIGKDQFYPAYSGKIAKFQLHHCAGAFDPKFPPDTRPESTPPGVIPPPTPPHTPTPKPKTPTKTPIPTPPKPKTPKSPTQPPTPMIPSFEVPHYCIKGPDATLNAAYDGDAVVDTEVVGKDLEDASEYGFGFWFRFLTRHPKPLFDGKKEPWYFVARLTSNQDYQDVNFGDRVLSIFQGLGNYQFSTMDSRTKNPNVNQNVDYDDIEGVWSYIYFSYGSKVRRADAFMKMVGEDLKHLQFDATHPVPTYLRLILGGKNAGIYPGLNGQYQKPTLRIGGGAYLNDISSFNKYALQCNPVPKPLCVQRGLITAISQIQSFEVDDRNPEIIKSDYPMPQEYAVAAWYKWREPKTKAPWHLLFRVSHNIGDDNRNAERLGDRTLSGFVGTEKNILAFATYSYGDLVGDGNPNVHQVVNYNDQLTKWHFVYFAYSRPLRKAIAFIEFKSGRINLEFNQVNHFLASQHNLYVAKDPFYASYSGKIAYFQYILCSGAFNPSYPIDPRPPETPPVAPKPKTPTPTPVKPKTPTPEKPKSPTPEQPKTPTPEKPKTPVKPKTPTPEKPKSPTPEKPKSPTPEKPKTPPKTPTPPVRPPTPVTPPIDIPPEPKTPTPMPPEIVPPPPPVKVCVDGPKVIADSTPKEPVSTVEINGKDLSDSSEYGFGFWMRFLTRYPTPFYEGKQAPWYFIARLTSNKPYANVNFGDRTLGLWQGQGSYHFTTLDTVSKNSNVNAHIEYQDIEAVWTYIYFSYSEVNHRAIAFLTYDDNEVQKLTFDVSHPVPKLLKFILGGDDQGNYPAFNGQFTRQVLRVGTGSYIDSEENLLKYTRSCNPKPAKDCTKPRVQTLWKEAKSFIVDNRRAKQILSDSEAAFPEEYAISGWFKWTPTEQLPWHSMFSLSQNEAESNKNSELLGDRTLSAYVGQGAIAFATYSYTDLNGQYNEFNIRRHGNPNVHQQIPYRNQLNLWHHVYFGYSRPQRKAIVMVWFQSGKVEVTMQQVNHFVSKQMYLHVAKDRFYPSYNGWIFDFQLHLCEYDEKYTPSNFNYLLQADPHPKTPPPQPPYVPTPTPTPTPTHTPTPPPIHTPTPPPTHTPTPPPIHTPTPPPPPIPKKPKTPEILSTCLDIIKYEEINLNNVDEILALIAQRKSELLNGKSQAANKMCYCTYNPNRQEFLAHETEFSEAVERYIGGGKLNP